MGAAQVVCVALVDIGRLSLRLCARGDQPLCRTRLHVEEEYGVGDGQSEFVELEVIEPVEKGIALRRIPDLHGLMHHVRCGIAVGEDDRPRRIVLSPLHPIGGVAVNGKEGRGGVWIHLVRLCAEVAAQVHPHGHRRIRRVVGKGNGAYAMPLAYEALREKARLRFLARAVARFDDKELSACHTYPFAITVTVSRDASAAPTTRAPIARIVCRQRRVAASITSPGARTGMPGG